MAANVDSQTGRRTSQALHYVKKRAIDSDGSRGSVLVLDFPCNDAVVVYRPRSTRNSAAGSEVDHLTVQVEKSMFIVPSRFRVANYLTDFVNVIGSTAISTERAQVKGLAINPHGGMAVAFRCDC